MKILLVTNSLTPIASRHLGLKESVRGGWVYSSAKRLALTETVAIASVYPCKEILTFKEADIQYYIVPCESREKYSIKMEGLWKEINNEFQPDITHIYGTEYPLTLNYINSCGARNVLISIQGLISQYLPYYYGGLSFKEIFCFLSIKDIKNKMTLFHYKNSFKKRSKYEIEALKKVKYIEGRTSWDKENCWAINPKAQYFHCNRTLRDEFYLHEWEYAKCNKYSIFLSQVHNPLKGFHKVLDALCIVKQQFPKVKLIVTASIDMNSSKLKDRITGRGYLTYLKNKIINLGLEENVEFMGLLSEKEMCKMFLKSNVFVCPSSIENSPNSLGEAQVLGVPSISSYVGGSMDMIEDGKNGFLYRFEETNMLAYKICYIFSQKEEIEKIAKQGRQTALRRHDSDTNLHELINIYQSIYNAKK